ncbi:MAG: right-handed parallel beta-helix repeat-containing protein [Candidatus Hydrogenedentes bacterium]|nr:right-handed parallel beta-helix repeat-containing protein [Candidatus Hydrogenedentota bacterium]
MLSGRAASNSRLSGRIPKLAPAFAGMVAIVVVSWTQAATAKEFFVSPQGNDAWSGALADPNPGKTDGPFATLEKARDTIRADKKTGGISSGGVTVLVRGGTYERSAPFELDGEDAGTAESPIVYRPYKNEPVRLIGGKAIAKFGPVTDAAILSRFDESARAHILQSDLKAQGITEYGTLKPRGFGRPSQPAALELFFQGKPMTLSRWPNEGWTNIASVPSGAESGKFTYDGDRPARWANPTDVWLHGYWTWDWAESFEKVASINKDTKEIATVAPHGVYGYKAKARYYALNVLEELDQPGEYFVDRSSGMLYFWSPAPMENAGVLVSMLEAPLVTIKDASYITIQGFMFECSRGPGLALTGGENNLIAGCTFANLGNYGVSIGGGKANGVTGCDLYNLGDGGISVVGGDRKTLTAAGNFADNNHIHDFSLTVRTYTSAVQVDGVGNRVTHNLIHNAPHMAIGLGGNDHLIEFNEVHHVCMETHDAGAFYMGRDWSQRGNVVRYNFFHEMGNGDVQAIYLDDWTSGVTVYGNICQGALRGILVGGGRDNIMENNIFVNCGQAIHIDQRGLGWAKNYFDGREKTLFNRLDAVNATKPPYTDKYPELAKLLDDEPVLAKGNKIIRNIRVGGKWLDLTDGLSETTPYLTFQDNFTEGDPGFVNADKLDFRLKPDSPALSLGFKPIPVDKIGLQVDAFRTTLPGGSR